MRGLDYLSEFGRDLRAGCRIPVCMRRWRRWRPASGSASCRLIARTRPELVPVLARELSLLRSYWMVVHADMAETLQVRLAQRFIREAVADAAAMFMGRGIEAS